MLDSRWTSIIEVRMIRWMNGMSREIKTRNEYIRSSVEIASIIGSEKEREYN